MMEENKFIEFLSKHWSKLLLGVLTLACIGVWTERFFKDDQMQSKQDFVMAKQIFDRFQRGETLAVESIEATENILDRHPELHPKYDTMLALIFFSQQKSPKAMQYALSTINHVDKSLPSYYKTYAQTSLLISEEKYEEALEAAKKLESQLINQEGYNTLDAMNTLRLIFLTDKLGEKEQKQIAWDKLKKHPSYLFIEPLFKEGKISLADFIDRTYTTPFNN